MTEQVDVLLTDIGQLVTNAAGMAQGMAKLDTASVCRVLEGMAGLKRE